MSEAVEICEKYWPDAFKDNRYFSWSLSYESLTQHMGETVLSAQDNDYQGSSYFLLRDGDRFGYLEFGWGSCSGCDALQAADSPEDLGRVFISLRDSIHWEESLPKLLDWFKAHDWKGNWSWGDGVKEFVAKLNETYNLGIEVVE